MCWSSSSAGFSWIPTAVQEILKLDGNPPNGYLLLPPKGQSRASLEVKITGLTVNAQQLVRFPVQLDMHFCNCWAHVTGCEGLVLAIDFPQLSQLSWRLS